MDYSELDMTIGLLFLSAQLPFIYLCWAGGYLDGLTQSARADGWIAPSLRRRLKRHKTAAQRWDEEFNPNGPAFARPKRLAPDQVAAELEQMESWYRQ